MKRGLLAVIGFGLLGLLAGAWLLLTPRPEPQVQARLAGLAGVKPAGSDQGYLRASGPFELNFPADHGPHPDYQTEWWYYTGNLAGESGQRFGYQLTFFRRALIAPDQRARRDSTWAADQVYMAHLTLTDTGSARFQAFERFSRGAAGLAGAQAAPYRVWLEDWQVEQTEPGITHLRASQKGVKLDLLLIDRKGPILQGDRGYSRKGPQPGNASYYYSLTRLETTGTVDVLDASFRVSGQSWMDHEWSTSSLGEGQVGWDWFSIQLDDGGELMVFQLRRADGSIDPFSSGTLIAADGSTRPLLREDFQIQVGSTWRSPHSGAVYPAQWTVTIPTAALILQLSPLLADQELNVSYSYWEGAVRVEGQRSGQPVTGRGYVELTGYAGSMQGQF